MLENFSTLLAGKATITAPHSTQPIKELELAMKDNSKLTCPWHKRNHPGHQGNFGQMGECLDCMAEVLVGRCEVNVKNFDFDTYWQVKRFWEKVDIKGPDECWEWQGAVKKNGEETVACFLSPFHSAKTQSAARVAFWTSRGYTGKLRTFHQEGCAITCCNPRHLKLRELESIPVPTEVPVVNLSYGNVFDHAKANNLQGNF